MIFLIISFISFYDPAGAVRLSGRGYVCLNMHLSVHVSVCESVFQLYISECMDVCQSGPRDTNDVFKVIGSKVKGSDRQFLVLCTGRTK